MENKNEIAIFAAGCFWGVESAFRKIPGVIDVVSGYTGGRVKNPTYEQVCSGTTGHIEAVQVSFDPDIVSYTELVMAFWNMHNPTEWNRQGPDVGEQYRSAIFFTNPSQEKQATISKELLGKSGKFEKPIVTEVRPAETFWKAEEYHQRYFEKKGIDPTCHI
ncbi:MAG: Peptide methionine sulfoxide reductase MsrA [Candidatus Parcubacteria bacterium]|jgi:peptide-methionine (S)-S-oxide reductase